MGLNSYRTLIIRLFIERFSRNTK